MEYLINDTFLMSEEKVGKESTIRENNLSLGETSNVNQDEEDIRKTVYPIMLPVSIAFIFLLYYN